MCQYESESLIYHLVNTLFSFNIGLLPVCHPMSPLPGQAVRQSVAPGSVDQISSTPLITYLTAQRQHAACSQAGGDLCSTGVSNVLVT